MRLKRLDEGEEMTRDKESELERVEKSLQCVVFVVFALFDCRFIFSSFVLYFFYFTKPAPLCVAGTTLSAAWRGEAARRRRRRHHQKRARRRRWARPRAGQPKRRRRRRTRPTSCTTTTANTTTRRAARSRWIPVISPLSPLPLLPVCRAFLSFPSSVSCRVIRPTSHRGTWPCVCRVSCRCSHSAHKERIRAAGQGRGGGGRRDPRRDGSRRSRWQQRVPLLLVLVVFTTCGGRARLGDLR